MNRRRMLLGALAAPFAVLAARAGDRRRTLRTKPLPVTLTETIAITGISWWLANDSTIVFGTGRYTSPPLRLVGVDWRRGELTVASMENA